MKNGLTLRERHRAQTIREIVDAAFDLFASQGYNATTVEQIASRVGIAPRTFFRYFPSKEDVVFGDEESTVARLREGLQEMEPGELPLRHVARVILAVQQPGSNARMERVRAELIAQIPAVHARSLRLVEALEEEIAAALLPHLTQHNRQVGTARMIAGAIFGSLRGARRTAGENRTADPEALVMAALRIAEHGAATYFIAVTDQTNDTTS